MNYSFSYFYTAETMSAATPIQSPPVIHEFGPMLHGQMRYYDARMDRWVAEKPVHVEQYRKDT